MGSEWREFRLGEVCSKIGSGATPRGGSDVYLEDGPYSLIRSQNVYNDGFHWEGLAYIGELHARELDGVDVRQGDILINITGDSVARVCQVNDAALPARVNQHVAILRPDPSVLDPLFLRYALVKPEMQTSLLAMASAGATRNALTKGMLEALVVQAPSDVGEQKRIAHILGTLDDKIELNRQMNRTLEEMARALFKSWFVDFDPVRAKMSGRWTRTTPLPGLPTSLFDLFPDHLVDSELGEIPAGWQIGTLAEIADLNPEAWSLVNRPEFIRYVDLANTKWGRIESIAEYSSGDAPSRAQRVLRPGDTIVGTVRPGNGSFALVTQEGLTGSTGFAALRPKSRRLTELVYLCATSSESIATLSDLADGGAYPAVRPDVVGKIQVMLASDSLISEFSAIVSEMMNRISVANLESEELIEVRDSCLAALF